MTKREEESGDSKINSLTPEISLFSTVSSSFGVAIFFPLIFSLHFLSRLARRRRSDGNSSSKSIDLHKKLASELLTTLTYLDGI